MNFIIWIVVGGLIGWVASMIMKTDAQQGIFLNIVVGIVGALLGGWLISPLVGVPTINQDAFSIGALVVSLIGAIILLAIVNLFRRGKVRLIDFQHKETQMNRDTTKGLDPTPDANRDPITRHAGFASGRYGIGAAAGGIAAGAAAGTLAAGPVGTVVGAAIGAVAGGLAGKAVAESIDPTVVDTHWRGRYEREPYFESGMTYDDYAPSYRLGADARARNANVQV